MKAFVSEYKGFLLFLLLMLVFRSALADWNQVPSGSMRPTIIEGDRILVDRTAYNLRLPLAGISLRQLGEPQRGEVVVFDSAVAEMRMVKRVVGLPGDVVAVRGNRLSINGQWASYAPAADADEPHVFAEQLAGMRQRVRLDPQPRSQRSDFGPEIVPPGHYFVLGDNRDNSADSRYYGFVPQDELVGRSPTVVLSLDPDNYFLPRGGRVWQAL
jgi:signal peptidase I